MVDEGERGIKRQRERGLKDERRRGGRRTSRSCRRRWRLLCTGRCSVSTRNRTGEEGEDTRRADGAKEEKKRKKDRRREGREGGGEREGTGGLVAATLRYDSRLSYPPHYLVLLPSLPPPPFLPMLLLVPVSTPPSLRTNPSSPAQRRLSPLSADPRSAPTTSCLDGAYTDAANFAHRRTLARATVSCDSPSLSVRTVLSLSHHTDLSYSRSAFFSFHGVCLFLTFSHRRVLSRVHTHGPDTRAPLGSLGER